MEHNLTPELVRYLKEEGYKLFYAKGQLQKEDIVFTPLFISIEDFHDYKPLEDAIITIYEALHLPFEVMLKLKVAF